MVYLGLVKWLINTDESITPKAQLPVLNRMGKGSMSVFIMRSNNLKLLVNILYQYVLSIEAMNNVMLIQCGKTFFDIFDYIQTAKGWHGPRLAKSITLLTAIPAQQNFQVYCYS